MRRADAKWKLIDALLEEARTELSRAWNDQHRADIFTDLLIGAIGEFADAEIRDALEDKHGSDY